MDGSKSNDNYVNSETHSGSGEPGFVFTEYDRGARPAEKGSSSRDEETAETESQRPQN